MSYQLGGADFTTADALTIALACVAVIVSFFAIAKGCEKFLQKKKEGYAGNVVLPNFSISEQKCGMNGTNQAGQVSGPCNNSNGIGDAAAGKGERWVRPMKEHASFRPSSLVDKVKSYAHKLKENFAIVTDNSLSQQNGQFVLGSQKERMGETCVGTGKPFFPGQKSQLQCEGYTDAAHTKVSALGVGPDGRPFNEHLTIYNTNGKLLREHMGAKCTLYPDGKCREHMDVYLNSRNDPSDLTIYSLHTNPALGRPRDYGTIAGKEHFDANGYVQTVDDVAYQCNPMNTTVPPTPAGGALSYLRLVPQDAEQALGAELPYDTNALGQAELTNTDATNVDVGQLLLKFGPDEITANNVALVGEDGFIARELKYRKKPVVLTDGVNTYTFNTYEEWANFQYNPMNSGATADMGVGSAMENDVESFIPNARTQGWTLSSPFAFMSNPIGAVSTARSRVASKNFY